MSGSNSNKDDLTKSDITRIEDLEEFVHEDDPEIDALFSEETQPSLSVDRDDDLADITTADLLSSIEDEVQEEITDFENEETELPDLPDESFENEDESFDNDDYSNDVENEEYSTEPDSSLNDDEYDEDIDSHEQKFSEEDNETTLEEHFEDKSEEFENDSQSDNFLPEDEASRLLEGKDEEISSDEQFGTLEDNDIEDHSTESVEEQEPEDEEINTDTEAEIGDHEQDDISEIEASLAESREDLSDLVNFVDNMTFGKVQMGGSPAFSVLLSGLPEKFHENIVSFLKEVGLCQDENEEKNIRLSLDLNQLLIPQISEYSAIYIAGKMKNFCQNIQLGLADMIHVSEQYLDDNKGRRRMTQCLILSMAGTTARF